MIRPSRFCGLGEPVGSTYRQAAQRGAGLSGGQPQASRREEGDGLDREFRKLAEHKMECNRGISISPGSEFQPRSAEAAAGVEAVVLAGGGMAGASARLRTRCAVPCFRWPAFR